LSKFYVGQRVRIVRPEHKENMGAEGVISYLSAPWPTINGFANCRAQWDRPVNGNCAHTDQLEPLTPPAIESAIAAIQKMPGADFSIDAPKEKARG
jgi:hypothetical protein